MTHRERFPYALFVFWAFCACAQVPGVVDGDVFSAVVFGIIVGWMTESAAVWALS